jgi:outer membrane protein
MPRQSLSRPLALRLWLAAGFCSAAVVVGGCAHSPIKTESEKTLRESVLESVRREVRDLKDNTAPRELTREDRISTLGISPQFMDELNRMAGPQAQSATVVDLGVDLQGKPVRAVAMGLERVVKTTVDNNIAVEFARVAPAIASARTAAAEAAFDWTFFANTQFNFTDTPRIRNSFGGSGFSLGNDRQDSTQTEAGLRRPLVTGGRFTLQQNLTYTDNKTEGVLVDPDPSAQLAYTVQYDQPLLRGSGSEVALAEVRLGRNTERRSIMDLKRDLIERVTDAERTYWQLMQSQRELLITQSLLARGEKTLEQLRGRVVLDAAQAQIADAAARVERRRADVLRAKSQLRQVSDRLKSLMNDKELTVGSGALLVPADSAIDQPISFSVHESILRAVSERPEIVQAVLTIDDTSIRQTVAENARLPQFDLRLQARLNSLDENTGGAYNSVLDGEFVDYLVGLVFEQPVGNRVAEANMRQRRLERSQAVIAYRNAVQQITLEVRTALERVALNYQLITQTRTGRVAAAESLRSFLVEKELQRGFTVEALNLELNRQESLAQAEREEIAALADYNSSLAELYQAMGTTLDRNNIKFVVPEATTIDKKRGYDPK